MFWKKEDILVGDVSGTHTRFALIDENKSIVAIQELLTGRGVTFEEALRQFLSSESVKSRKFSRACFGIAGMLNKERTFAQLTNANWAIDAPEIQKKFNLKEVKLINDFEALGFEVDKLKHNQYVELTTHGENTLGTISIVGAGTGLGMSILYKYGSKHLPMASEGGHTDPCLYPTNTIELELYNYLKKLGVTFDNEELVSTRGIINIYNFLLTKKMKHDKKYMLEIKSASLEDKPRLITKYALAKDPLCQKATELFITLYARVARNLAITTLCSELILAGGIAPNILPLMKDIFVDAFCQHDSRMIRNMLEGITVLVITDRFVPLYGAMSAVLKS